MRESELLESLEEVAKRLNIRVRREAFRGAGGLCVLHGEMHVILNRARTPMEQVETLAESLALVDLDGVFIAPKVRECIDNARVAMEAPKSRTA